MAVPIYDQVTSPEQNLLNLLAVQASANPVLGQEAFAVLVTKAVLNLFSASNTGIAESGSYLTKADNLSGISNPLQALANIGGMARSSFVDGLAGINDGIVVKKLDGTSVARTLVAGSGIVVTEGKGNAGDPTISVSARLSQLDSTLLQDLWGFVYRSGNVNGMSLLSASLGNAPLKIAAGSKFEVILNTQCVFLAPMDVDGELIIDGVIHSV